MSIVSTDLHLSLVLGDDRSVTVPTTLTYSTQSPYAVTAEFHTQQGDVLWVFGRELLEAGLVGPEGEGDVEVWPAMVGGVLVVCLALNSPNGSALLEADAGAIRRFLDDSFSIVPQGQESAHLNLDRELVELLGNPLR